MRIAKSEKPTNLYVDAVYLDLVTGNLPDKSV